MGIRIALGSSRAKIFGLIVRQGMVMVGLGVFAGIIVFLGCSALMRHFVYGVRPDDPPTIIAVTLLLGTTAMLACWLPARRAMRVDPIQALRVE
jgi:putative ABC transport system permease protein